MLAYLCLSNSLIVLLTEEDELWCSEPTPSLRIVEDADLVAAEASQKTDMTASQKLFNDGSVADNTDALDMVSCLHNAVESLCQLVSS